MRRLVLPLAAALMLSACTVWPVGQDPYGMDLRRGANEILMAIQSYHRDTGAYPASLASLAPKYLPAAPEIPRLAYDSGDGSLAYKYTPSWPQLRPVWCHSIGDQTDWNCEEHIL
ncbi:MAG: hypothetical protein ACREHE_09705 [Rhizomicrobium sp.]